uniref:N-alpha-acetyltransferase 60 n=1 Tax=Scapholeberis mucronata TaxID=202097 RepID=A0A4Y7NMJ8_9CRUS|nr:EOG090X0BM0 [Scapholeberis mucronata]SVE93826.1 EOG090X0BM0 [Scapholeberis mucronata]
MANTPAIYWGGASLSDYSSVPVIELQSVVDMITQTADKMNGGQLGVLYAKRLMYAEAQLENDVTVENLSRQPLLIAHMSPDHVNAFPLSATIDLFKVVYALQSRLKNFTRYLGSKNATNRDQHYDTAKEYLNPLFTSTVDLQLRFLCPSDVDQVKELCKEWFPIQYPDTWYREITSDPRFYSLAAVYQSSLVGLLIAEVKQSSSINQEDKGILDTRMYSHCTVGYILSLGVCSSFRRQGVASLLLDSFLNHVTHLENQICKAVYLHVLTMNSAAIRFYEKHYFRLHSFLPYYYSVDGKCKDGFTYVLYINGGHPPWGLLYPFSPKRILYLNPIKLYFIIFLNSFALIIYIIGATLCTRTSIRRTGTPNSSTGYRGHFETSSRRHLLDRSQILQRISL